MTDNPKNGEPVSERSGRQTKFLIGGAIVVAVIGYLVFRSLGGSTAEYLTVAQAQAASDQIVRVNGAVIGDSIQFDGQVLRFELSDDTGKLPVVYNGVQPDMLKDGATAIVEGKAASDGVFHASQIILKCPSKYEEAATEEAGSN